jgi:hypothetical protein
MASIVDTSEIHVPGSRERVALVERVCDDGTICLVYEDGRRGRAAANGLGTEELRSYLVDLFQEIEDDLGAPYLVVQHRHDSSVAWVPDGDGTLHRLRVLLLEAGVLTPENV